MLRYFHLTKPVTLECSGAVLPEITIAYTVHGNIQHNKIIWICHALTANANPLDWWPGVFGSDKAFDLDRYTVICANMLGSCYGSTGPLTINPLTQQIYGHQFPAITIRDMVMALEALREALNIEKIELVIGGSMGGMQALEWAISFPHRFNKMILLATNARHSAWGIAFNEAQRMAIRADSTFFTGDDARAGSAGMAAARAIALLSYRNYQAYNKTQTATDDNQLDNFPAITYQQYQGQKLVQRFNALSYMILSQAMDRHHVGRGRNSISDALTQIRAKTIIIGIDSDILFPISEQQLLAELIPDAHLEIISSDYGHDGFLLEYDKINPIIIQLLSN